MKTRHKWNLRCCWLLTLLVFYYPYIFFVTELHPLWQQSLEFVEFVEFSIQNCLVYFYRYRINEIFEFLTEIHVIAVWIGHYCRLSCWICSCTLPLFVIISRNYGTFPFWKNIFWTKLKWYRYILLQFFFYAVMYFRKL